MKKRIRTEGCGFLRIQNGKPRILVSVFFFFYPCKSINPCPSVSFGLRAQFSRDVTAEGSGQVVVTEIGGDGVDDCAGRVPLRRGGVALAQRIQRAGGIDPGLPADGPHPHPRIYKSAGSSGRRRR